MANSFIQVALDGAGKMMQTFLNTISGNAVHAEAVVLVDTSGAAITQLPISIDAQSSDVIVNDSPRARIAGILIDYAPLSTNSGPNVASLLVKNSAAIMLNMNGYNAKTSAQFIQVHDSSSVPAEGAAPLLVLRVPASSNFSIDFGTKFGRYFAFGIAVCNSSTMATKTIGAADCFFDCQYLI